MSYIGPDPAEAFTSYATETFSVSATTSYTLANSVANENELALFVNNVRQQPGSGKAYTASGTALTLSAATASTDTMYAIYLGRALQTSVPATNSITAAMVSSFGPAFHVRLSANQTLAHDTLTRITWDTEVFDTDGCYDNSTNYRFTPTVSGKYYFYGIVNVISTDTNTGYDYGGAEFKKNGTVILRNEMTIIDTGSQYWYNINGVIDMNGSSDYLEMFAYITGSGTLTFQGGATTGRNSRWGAYKLIGA